MPKQANATKLSNGKNSAVDFKEIGRAAHEKMDIFEGIQATGISEDILCKAFNVEAKYFRDLRVGKINPDDHCRLFEEFVANLRIFLNQDWVLIRLWLESENVSLNRRPVDLLGLPGGLRILNKYIGQINRRVTGRPAAVSEAA